jgi:GNAT superfamily N-acetyltransferase
MNIDFVDCQPDQWRDVRDFMARMYRPTYRLATDEALLRWQYGPTPASTQAASHLKLATLDGRIVGCLGHIPVEVSLNGHVVRGTWVVNWMTDPAQRGHGIGVNLMRDVIQTFDVALALGTNEASQYLFSRMGWRDIGNLPRYVCVLDEPLAARLTESGQLAWPVTAAAVAPGTDVGRVPRFDAAATALWDRTWGANGSGAGGARRSAEYLNWRYAMHPAFEYRLFAEQRNGRLTGLAVYHVEAVRDLPVRVGRLVELITETDNDNGVLSAVLHDARRQGVAVMDFFCASRRVEGLLARHGFLPGENAAAAQIPVLFQPVDRRRGGIRFMTQLGTAPEADHVLDWYVTKSDADQDRPN